MAVYYTYDNNYATPLVYEHSLVSQQKEEEIINLKNQLAMAHRDIFDNDNRISALELKNKHLLDGYNKRQLNYSTTLNVLQTKNRTDAEEIRKLREENSKLKNKIDDKNKKKVLVTKTEVEKVLLKKRMAELEKEINDRKHALNKTKKIVNSKYQYFREAIKPDIDIESLDTKSHQVTNSKVIKGTHLVTDIEKSIQQAHVTKYFVKGVHYVGDIESAFRHNKPIRSNNEGVGVITAPLKRPSNSYSQQECDITDKFGIKRGFC